MTDPELEYFAASRTKFVRNKGQVEIITQDGNLNMSMNDLIYFVMECFYKPMMIKRIKERNWINLLGIEFVSKWF